MKKSIMPTTQKKSTQHKNTTSFDGIWAQYRPKTLLWLEFVLFYIAAPLSIWWWELYSHLFGIFLLLCLVALFLLARTPQFTWRSLGDFSSLTQYFPLIFLFTLLSTSLLAILALLVVPDRFFSLPLENPQLWLGIMIFYPIFSAFPQELLFRVLFFNRYRHLYASPNQAIFVNALCFSLAHVFYANWIACALSFLGGLVMAKAYVKTGSFYLVWILHVIAGLGVFTVGLGIYFYHGAIGQY